MEKNQDERKNHGLSVFKRLNLGSWLVQAEAKKWRNHTVPRTYIELFSAQDLSTAKKLPHIYDKHPQKGCPDNFLPSSLRNYPVNEQYYWHHDVLINSDGEEIEVRLTDEIEGELAKFDNKIPKLLQQLSPATARDFLQSDAWKDGLAEFVAQLFVRNPAFIEGYAKMIIAKELRADLLDTDGQERLEILKNPSQFWSYIFTLKEILKKRHWSLKIAPPGRMFFTSDTPVLYANGPDGRKGVTTLPWMPHTVVMAPLTPSVSLVITPISWARKHPSIHHLSRPAFDKLCDGFAMGAYRFIFSPLKTKGILDLVNKHANRRLEFLYGLSEEALYK